MQHKYKRIVVCGPPGSGKTTWVERHARPGDLRWDYDHIHATLTGLPVHDRRDGYIGLLLSFERQMVEWVSRECPEANVYVIVSGERVAREIAAKMQAEVVVLGPRGGRG